MMTDKELGALVDAYKKDNRGVVPSHLLEKYGLKSTYVELIGEQVCDAEDTAFVLAILEAQLTACQRERERFKQMLEYIADGGKAPRTSAQAVLDEAREGQDDD